MQPMCLSRKRCRCRPRSRKELFGIVLNAETQLSCVYFLRIGVLRKPVGRVARGLERDGQ